MIKTLYTSEYSKLRTWLKEQREARGLTMRELAHILDVSHSFVGKIENGERRLDVIEYLQYCEALQVNPKEGLAAIDSKYR